MTRPKIFYGYYIVLAAFILEILSWAMLYTYGVFFKPMLAEFGWSRAVTSGAYSVCVIVTGVLAIVSGRLSDKIGPRAIFTVCGLLLGIGYFLMSMVGSVWQLYLVFGVVIGIGTGAVFPPLLSTVSRWFVKRRGLMTGVTVSGIGFGLLFLSPLAAWLIDQYGWRDSYRLLALVVAVLFTLAAQVMRRDPSQMGLRPYGEDDVVLKDPGLGVGGFSAPQAMSTRQFWTVCAMFLCLGFCLQIVLVHIVSHATDIGIPPASAATVLSAVGGVSIAGRLILGTTSDRIGNRRATVACFGLLTLGILWLLMVDRMWMFYVFAVVFGFAYGGLISLNSLIVAELFGLASMGVILGLITFGYAIGESVGPTVAGRIFDVTGSYQPAFIISAVLSLGATVLATTLRPIKGR